MIRVLHVINGMGTGGAEKDIMNWYRNIDRSKVQFDFLIRTDEIFYKKEIEKLGGSVYRVAGFPKKLFYNIRETRNFIKKNKNKYKAIHVHGNALIYIYPLMCAKRYGIKIRIYHSHNTKANSKMAEFVHRCNRLIIHKYINKPVACSINAGIFTYGKQSCTVINNAMDLEKINSCVKYSKNKFEISDSTLLLGHVGRFLPVKNQKFVLDVFNEIHSVIPDSHLLLVGVGPTMSEVQDYSKKIGIRESVEFLGERNDVESIVKALDCMIFPSLYEGVPLVVLESQVCGTKIICSDTVDKSVKLTPLVEFESLNSNAKEWAERVLTFLSNNISCDVSKEFKKAKYDIESIIEQLYVLYEVDLKN